MHRDATPVFRKLEKIFIAIIGLLMFSAAASAQDREISLSDDFLASQCVGSAEEIDLCLAQLAMANESPDFCKRSASGKCANLVARAGLQQCASKSDTAERWICEMGVIDHYPDPDACVSSMDHDNCISMVAVTRKEPNLIAERIKNPEAMTLYLGAYASTARDLRSLDYLEDPRHHDLALVLSAFSVGYGLDRELGAAHCARLRGGYGETEDEFSADQIAGMCRYFSGLSDSMLAQEQSIETPTQLEQFQAQTSAQLAALMEGVDTGTLDLGELIPEFADDLDTTDQDFTGVWSGTWKRNDTKATGGFQMAISMNDDGSLKGSFLGQPAKRVTRSGNVVTMVIEPSSECDGANLRFIFKDGAPESGNYTTYGSASTCGRTGEYSF